MGEEKLRSVQSLAQAQGEDSEACFDEMAGSRTTLFRFKKCTVYFFALASR